jgi:hypothetical protein
MKEMGGGCLVAGTKIQTVKGSVPIESIQVGDKVRTMFGYSYVTDTFCFTSIPIPPYHLVPTTHSHLPAYTFRQHIQE